MTKEKNYITSDTYQKSFNYLFPLLGIKKKLEFEPYSTYLFWDEKIEENIFDYKIFVYYQEDVDSIKFKKFEETNILKNDKIVSCYSVDDGIVYMMDLISWSREVFHFLEGRYSKYSKEAKRTILSHFGVSDDNKIIPGRPIYQSLYPEKFFDKAVNDLGDYVTIDDLRRVGELCNKYDKKEETLNKLIIDNCDCVEIKRIIYDTNK